MELESDDDINQVFNSLNSIREHPEASRKTFLTIAKAFQRIKKKKEAEELEAFSNTLTSMSPVQGLKLSGGLCKSAAERVNAIAFGGDKHMKEDIEELRERTLRYVLPSFTNIVEISDHGSVDQILARLMIADHDPERVYRKIIFSNKYNHVGIATKTVKDEEMTVLVFADIIQEIPDKSIQEQILDSINDFRRNPSVRANDFSQMTFSRNRSFSNTIKELTSRLKSMKSLKPVTTSEHLNDLASALAEKYIGESLVEEDFNDTATMSSIAKNSINGFLVIFGAVNVGKATARDIVNALIAEPQAKSINGQDVIINSAITQIGIFHGKNTDENPLTVIVGVDICFEGAERSFEGYLEDELNRLRRTPESYCNDLKAYKANINVVTYKGKLIKEINELEQKLQKMSALPKLTNSENLNHAAMEYLDHFTTGYKKFYAEDDEFLYLRLAHYITGYKICKELLDEGCIRPEHLITEFLVNENDSTRRYRNALLNDSFKYFGCAQKVVLGKRITIIILTDNVSDLPKKSFTEELLDELNHLRNYPKSYIKCLQKLIENVPEKAKDRSATINNLESHIEFLKKTRIFGAFERNTLLDNSAQTRVANYKETGLKPATKDDIKNFLSDFGIEYNFYGQAAGLATASGDNPEEPYFDPKEWITNQIARDTSENREFLNNIFNINMFFVGISHDPESNIVVCFFTDDVSEKLTVNISVGDRWKRLTRPKFTDDEIQNLRHDFKKLDIQNQGFIKPNCILTFVNNMPAFVENNPFYFEALKILNTIENNETGINVNQFIDAVARVIADYEDSNWENLYNIYIRDGKKRTIDLDLFRQITKELGYTLNDEESQEMFERIVNDKASLGKSEFVQIMNIVENSGKRK